MKVRKHDLPKHAVVLSVFATGHAAVPARKPARTQNSLCSKLTDSVDLSAIGSPGQLIEQRTGKFRYKLAWSRRWSKFEEQIVPSNISSEHRYQKGQSTAQLLATLTGSRAFYNVRVLPFQRRRRASPSQTLDFGGIQSWMGRLHEILTKAILLTVLCGLLLPGTCKTTAYP